MEACHLVGSQLSAAHSLMSSECPGISDRALHPSPDSHRACHWACTLGLPLCLLPEALGCMGTFPKTLGCSLLKSNEMLVHVCVQLPSVHSTRFHPKSLRVPPVQVNLGTCNTSTIAAASSGAASCNFLVSQSLFPATGSAAAVASLAVSARISGTEVARSSAATVQLNPSPAQPSVSAVTMVATVPYRDLYAGDWAWALQHLLTCIWVWLSIPYRCSVPVQCIAVQIVTFQGC